MNKMHLFHFSSPNYRTMAEAVKVIVRCRPLNAREKSLNCKTVVNMVGKRGFCEIKKPDSKDPPKGFTFDGAYFVDSTTETIYADIAYPLVDVSINGLLKEE